jgi:glyceraldehyde 3-phosphate dehydrogenase
VQGRWRRDISVSNGACWSMASRSATAAPRTWLAVRGARPGWTSFSKPAASGARSTQLSPYLAAGVKKVIVAAPVKDGDTLNIVMGINDHLYDPARDHIVTAASCTTNCLAPVVKVVHEAIGITHGMITTIHSSTNTQSVHDQMHKDLRRAPVEPVAGADDDRFGDGDRADLPGTEGQARWPCGARAAAQRFADRLCLRDAAADDRRRGQWPVQGGCRRAAEGNPRLRGAAAGFHGLLGDPRSSIVDAAHTLVVNDTMLKIYAWYDNEWGYANRYVELARKLATRRSRTMPLRRSAPGLAARGGAPAPLWRRAMSEPSAKQDGDTRAPACATTPWSPAPTGRIR